MAKLTWDGPGERFYESGVDKGVLYVDYVGVAWNGLISVDQSPTGGEAKPTYIDGFKAFQRSSPEEFEATITAFQSPPEFDQFLGRKAIQNGLFAGEQPRKMFGFSWRVRVGNDVSEELGYKIHIVYNAMAAPSERSNQTISNEVSPVELSWKITSMPDSVDWSPTEAIKPTPHFVVDTRLVPEPLLTDFLDIIYGSDTEVPYIPYATDLIAMFAA